MNERSIEVYGTMHGASVKFDYFICSVSGALFAYIAQTYSPHKIEVGFSILEPISLLLLAVSFFAGLKRIETANTITRLNHNMLESDEKAGEIAKTLASRDLKPHHTFVNVVGGESIDVSTLQNLRLQYMEASKKSKSAIAKQNKLAVRYYKIRDIFLLLGFLTIFSAKVLQPYQHDNSTSLFATPSVSNPPAQLATSLEHQTNKPPLQ
jgi:hypothetical protein